MPRTEITPEKRRQYYETYMAKNRNNFNKQMCLRRALQNKTLPTLRSIMKYGITDEEVQIIKDNCASI